MQVVKAESNPSQKTPLSLPPELLDKAASRFCWISILCAVMTVTLLVAEGILQPEFGRAFQLASIQLTIGLTVAMSLG